MATTDAVRRPEASTATSPTRVAGDYGYLWWLNTAQKQYPSLPATSFTALGYGSNTIWIDPVHDPSVGPPARQRNEAADEAIEDLSGGGVLSRVELLHQGAEGIRIGHSLSL